MPLSVMNTMEPRLRLDRELAICKTQSKTAIQVPKLCIDVLLGDVQRRSASSAWGPFKAATGAVRDGILSLTEMCVRAMAP